MADWFNNAPVSGDQIATTTSSWNFASSTQTPHLVSVYFASVPLDPGKTVASVTLPTVGSGVGNGINAMHIFSIAAGNGTPTSGASASVNAANQSSTRGEAHFKARGLPPGPAGWPGLHSGAAARTLEC